MAISFFLLLLLLQNRSTLYFLFILYGFHFKIGLSLLASVEAVVFEWFRLLLLLDSKLPLFLLLPFLLSSIFHFSPSSPSSSLTHSVTCVSQSVSYATVLEDCG